MLEIYISLFPFNLNIVKTQFSLLFVCLSLQDAWTLRLCSLFIFTLTSILEIQTMLDSIRALHILHALFWNMPWTKVVFLNDTENSACASETCSELALGGLLSNYVLPFGRKSGGEARI